MALQYIQTQRVAFTPAHIQLACDGTYVVLPYTRTSVGVWSLQDIACKPLELVGHSKILTSLALGNVSVPKLVVSAASDYVIVWNVHQARQQLEKGEKIKGRVIGTTLGHVQYCSFSPDDTLVAVCTGFDIIILTSKSETIIATLEGHNGNVTGAEFCPHYTSTLVSISDDRTFKIWNLDDLTLVYQSPILTASPLLSIAMSYNEPQVAIGAADGVVRVIDLTDGNDFRCLHLMDVSRYIVKHKEAKLIKQQEETKPKGPVTISSRPTWKQTDKNTNTTTDNNPETIIETGYSVLGLYFTYKHRDTPTRNKPLRATKSLPFLHVENDVVKDLLDSSTMLCIGTTSGLLQVDSKSFEISSYQDFQEPIPSTLSLDGSEKVLNAAGSVLFGQNAQNKVWCIVGSPFQNLVHLLVWDKTNNVPNKKTNKSMNTEDALAGLESGFKDLNTTFVRSRTVSQASVQQLNELTVLSKESLLEDSPLRSELTPRPKDTQDRKPKDFVSSPQKGKILDNQPLTFKSKVKSSGYTAAPRMTMFKPKTSFSKSKTPAKSSARPSTRKTREYPMQGSVPTHTSMRLDVAERPTPVNAIKISEDGNYLACALANKSALVFPLPLSQSSTSYTEDGNYLACALANKSALVFPLPLSQSSTSYTGHNHMVNTVDWSHTGSNLLTSSDDKSAALWVKGQADPVLTINTTQHNLSSSGDGYSKERENKSFSRGIRYAQFYFMDKFILLCSCNTMYMYKYYIDPTKNDIQRYLSQSKYKCVQQWTSSSQTITAMSAVNSFLSYIVFCAGSNKSIDIYDMNVGEKIRHMPDVHSRPVHAICQNKGSMFASHPSTAYDLFATSAAGDCIKLWDLRSNRCVRRYEGHVNRVHPCGLAISPCGKYIATGSEDKSTYLFDLRSGTYLHKLTGQTDVVSDVAFHPSTPQLYISTLEGKIQMYTNR